MLLNLPYSYVNLLQCRYTLINSNKYLTPYPMDLMIIERRELFDVDKKL